MCWRMIYCVTLEVVTIMEDGDGDHVDQDGGDQDDDADGKAGHLYVAPGPFLITIGEEHGEGSGLGKRIINNFTSTSKRFVN